MTHTGRDGGKARGCQWGNCESEHISTYKHPNNHEYSLGSISKGFHRKYANIILHAYKSADVQGS